MASTFDTGLKDKHRGAEQEFGKAKEAGHEALQKGNEAMQKAKEGGEDAMRKAKEAGTQVIGKTKEAAAAVGEMATHTAAAVGQKADEVTSAAGHEIREFGDTIAHRGPHQGLAGAASQAVADSIKGSGRYIEEAKLSGMAHDVEQVVRNHPIPALLVCFGIGFCLGRVMKD